MMRKECFTAGRDLINRQIRYFRARAKCLRRLILICRVFHDPLVSLNFEGFDS